MEIPRLAIENQKDAPSEDKEESENAQIEMFILDVESYKEKQQTEGGSWWGWNATIANTNGNAQPSLGAGTSKDIESGEERHQIGAVLENGSKNEKSGLGKKANKIMYLSILLLLSVKRGSQL